MAAAYPQLRAILDMIPQFTTTYIPGTGTPINAPSSVGRRAAGGDVLGGMPYRVGEQGPELFVPDTAGMVVPNGGWGGGGGTSISVVVQAGIGDPVAIGEEVRRVLARADVRGVGR